MLQNIFNKNKSSEIQFLEIDLFWTSNSFYQVRFLILHPRFWDGTTTVLTTDLSQDENCDIKNPKLKKYPDIYLWVLVQLVYTEWIVSAPKLVFFSNARWFGRARKCVTKLSHRAYNVSTRALTSLTLVVYWKWC